MRRFVCLIGIMSDRWITLRRVIKKAVLSGTYLGAIWKVVDVLKDKWLCQSTWTALWLLFLRNLEWCCSREGILVPENTRDRGSWDRSSCQPLEFWHLHVAERLKTKVPLEWLPSWTKFLYSRRKWIQIDTKICRIAVKEEKPRTFRLY